MKHFPLASGIVLLLLLVSLKSLSAQGAGVGPRHSLPAESGTFQLLHVFSGPDGALPAKLVLEDSQKFLGVTTNGGANNTGTLFEATTAGTVTTLFDFADDPELIGPLTLVRATDGAFYGICQGDEFVPAAVFRFEPGSNPVSVHPFAPTEASRSLIAGSDGFLYGTMTEDGNVAGAVFRLSTTGDLTILYEFHQAFGGAPWLNLESADGNFYGNQSLPTPSIFRISPSGDFSYVIPAQYGQEIYSDIIEDTSGNLIVTALLTDAVLRVTKAGEVTTLHKFFQPTEGRGPLRIVQIPDGNFLGITSQGGEAGLGTIYELAPNGGFLVLHQFDLAVDGAFPDELVVHPNGRLYGLTQSGPGIAQGTLFNETPPDPASLPTPALLNLSTRAQVLNGDELLICGFIVSGDRPKKVLLRALGPSLAAAGLSGVLSDPILELHEPDGTVLSNDNWKDSQQAEIEGTSIPPADDKEAAIVATLIPGEYTAVGRGQDGGTGTALVEAYDLDQPIISQLLNTSVRSFVGIGDNVMIGGIILGAGNVRVLIRAIGPELTAQGVSGALLDPTLELHDQDGALIASNDDWKATQQTEIEATLIPPADDREAAILANLATGSYTAVVSGKDGATGVALLEVYNMGL